MLTLAAVAVLLLSPTLLLGTLISHSSPQNLTWAAQFSEQIRAGILYPRWMPDSFDGLGSPAFYFYPPLPFWADALVSVITANLMPVAYRLAVTSTLILLASGLAMRAWLLAETANPRVALWGAIAYMAAPYHLLDYYMRGAFAEFTAFVFLPLVLLAVRRPLLLPFAYAGLLLSHLPTALLVTVTVLPAYVLARAPRPGDLVRMIAAGSLGIGLSAIYLAPAMGLQGWISADQLWMPFYRVERWFVLTPARWPEPYIMQVVTWFTAGYAIVAIGLIVFFRRRFWPLLSLACLALIAGVVPWFWQLPELAKVQFPWRLLLVVEFATITALCLVPLGTLGRPKIYVFVAAFIALAPGLALVAADTIERGQYMLEVGARAARDVKEYQPRGYPQPEGLDISQLALEPLKDVPLIECRPAARLCAATPLPFGGLSIEIDADKPPGVILRRFFFPAWKIEGARRLAPTPDYRLVWFSADAGHHTYRLERVALPAEDWGWAISAASLVLLLAWAAWSGRSRPDTSRASASP